MRKNMTIEQAIEMLKEPEKYMYVQCGQIEIEGWLREAIRMGIEALKQSCKNDC